MRLRLNDSTEDRGTKCVQNMYTVSMHIWNEDVKTNVLNLAHPVMMVGILLYVFLATILLLQLLSSITAHSTSHVYRRRTERYRRAK